MSDVASSKVMAERQSGSGGSEVPTWGGGIMTLDKAVLIVQVKLDRAEVREIYMKVHAVQVEVQGNEDKVYVVEVV